MACLRHSISMRQEVDGEEVLVDVSSHAMKTRPFAPLNLRATRQPQALKRHGCRARVFSTCHSPKNLKKGGIWSLYKRAVMG